MANCTGRDARSVFVIVVLCAATASSCDQAPQQGSANAGTSAQTPVAKAATFKTREVVFRYSTGAVKLIETKRDEGKTYLSRPFQTDSGQWLEETDDIEPPLRSRWYLPDGTLLAETVWEADKSNYAFFLDDEGRIKAIMCAKNTTAEGPMIRFDPPVMPSAISNYIDGQETSRIEVAPD